MVLTFLKATGVVTLIEEGEVGSFFSVVLPDFGSATDKNPEGTGRA